MAGSLDHGGRLAEARQLFPAAPEPFIDLSTGINPVPFPFDAPPLEAYTRLPEPEDERALRKAAAEAYRVADPTMIVAAPGTQLLIGVLPRIVPLHDVAVLGPTYSEHALAWLAAGSRVVEVSRLSELSARSGAVVCNPNNPDGRRLSVDELARLADVLAAKGGVLVVDEAFADLETPDLSVARLLPREGLVVLRSFGKTYGLAGIRLGFALASPPLAEELRSTLGPWAVGGPAIAIARQAFADPDWLKQSRARLSRDGIRLDRLLTNAGMQVIGGTALFRLAASDDAAAHFDVLGRAGIFVRRFARNQRLLRFGIPSDGAAWQRLESALAAR